MAFVQQDEFVSVIGVPFHFDCIDGLFRKAYAKTTGKRSQQENAGAGSNAKMIKTATVATATQMDPDGRLDFKRQSNPNQSQQVILSKGSEGR